MKKLETCPNCKKKFWTKMVKVWVFKQRYCDKCDVKLKALKDTLVCPKCGKSWKRSDKNKLASLKTEVKRTTTDFLVAQQAREKFIEVEKVYVAVNHLCQNCRNVTGMMERYIKKQKKQQQGKIPTREEEIRMINQAIMRKHRQEWNERQQKEMMEKRKKQLKELLKKKKKTTKLIKEKKHKDVKVKKLVTVTESNFDQIASNPLVLIDCWAAWCKPCLVISPIVEKLAKEYAGKVTVGKLNVDENEALATRFNILGIPTLLIIKNGKEVDRIVGLSSKEAIKATLEKHLGK